MKIAGKAAVVTGGVSGIGLGIARALADAGMNVAITYRNEEHLREVMPWFESRPQIKVHPVRLEITDRAACARAAEEVERAFGKVHVLCNNAGIATTGYGDEASAEEWERILDVNLYGAVNVLAAFVPRILAHGEGGHIVNVASVAAFMPDPKTCLYSTSKFGLRGLTESLRNELSSRNVGVSLLSPGLTRSRITARSPPPTGASRVGAGPARLAALLESVAMSADEVGLRTLRGIERNDAWIFTHTEFRDEIEQIQDELLAELPEGRSDRPVNAG